jgi:hypothetical protein
LTRNRLLGTPFCTVFCLKHDRHRHNNIICTRGVICLSCVKRLRIVYYNNHSMYIYYNAYTLSYPYLTHVDYALGVHTFAQVFRFAAEYVLARQVREVNVIACLVFHKRYIENVFLRSVRATLNGRVRQLDPVPFVALYVPYDNGTCTTVTHIQHRCGLFHVLHHQVLQSAFRPAG